jgi:integrase
VAAKVPSCAWDHRDGEAINGANETKKELLLVRKPRMMRQTHATLMKALGVDGKLVADQLGHSLDVSQNVYTQRSVEIRLEAVNQLEQSLLVM